MSSSGHVESGFARLIPSDSSRSSIVRDRVFDCVREEELRLSRGVDRVVDDRVDRTGLSWKGA